MEPTQTNTKFFRRLTASGVAVTGKVLADFTIAAYQSVGGAAPAAYAGHGSTITELASGYYAWQFTMPAAGACLGLDLSVASGTDQLVFLPAQGEMEAHDLDTIYAASLRTTVILAGNGTIGQVTPITLINKRHVVKRFVFKDDSGALVNMTAGVTYTAYTFGVRLKTNQTTTPPKLDATNGSPAGFAITGGVGYVDVTIPENASFFTLAEGATPAQTETDLEYELTGDLVAISGETVSLIPSSDLTLSWRQVGT